MIPPKPKTFKSRSRITHPSVAESEPTALMTERSKCLWWLYSHMASVQSHQRIKLCRGRAMVLSPRKAQEMLGIPGSHQQPRYRPNAHLLATHSYPGQIGGLGSQPVLPGKFSTLLRHVLRHSIQATSPRDGTTARRSLRLRPGSGITHLWPPPSVVTAKNHLDGIAQPGLLCHTEQVALPRSVRASEQRIQGRERPDGELREERQLIECLSFSD